MLLFALFLLWQPVTEIPLFDLRNEYITPIFLFLLVMFILQFILTLPFFIETDLLGWKRMFKVIGSDSIEDPEFTKLSIPFIYRACRHPMQSSFMGMLIFSSPLYNLGRLIFVTSLIIGILIGVNQEEFFLCKFDEYRKYKTLVLNRYLANFLNAFDSKIKKELMFVKTN